MLGMVAQSACGDCPLEEAIFEIRLPGDPISLPATPLMVGGDDEVAWLLLECPGLPAARALPLDEEVRPGRTRGSSSAPARRWSRWRRAWPTWPRSIPCRRLSPCGPPSGCPTPRC
ncbi:MAG: hypothetical protein R3F43_20880 [bacterium]